MSDKPDGKENEDRRRFHRVTVGEVVDPQLSSYVVWPNNETTDIVDVSYKGMAIAAPKNVNLEACKDYLLKVKFEHFELVEVDAQVMWANQQVVGVYLESMSVSARNIFNKYIDQRLKGVKLRSIDPSYFKQGMDCDFWLHSNDVNLQIWTQDKKAIRCQLDMENSQIEVDRHHIHIGQTNAMPSPPKNPVAGYDIQKHLLLQAMGILSQVKIDGLDLAPLFSVIKKNLV